MPARFMRANSGKCSAVNGRVYVMEITPIGLVIL